LSSPVALQEHCYNCTMFIVKLPRWKCYEKHNAYTRTKI